MKGGALSRGRAAAVAALETIAALALVAWIGGHAALGAFAARIVFRDLPLGLAASTMTTIFRSFDALMLVAALLLLVAVTGRAIALGLGRGVDRVVLGVALGLTALAAFELGYVHPRIEEMFRAGRTLEPAFGQLHRLSERSGHLEVVLAAAFFGALAWGRGSRHEDAGASMRTQEQA